MTVVIETQIKYCKEQDFIKCGYITDIEKKQDEWLTKIKPIKEFLKGIFFTAP